MNSEAMEKVVELKAAAGVINQILSDMKKSYKELTEIYGTEAYTCGIKHSIKIIDEHLGHTANCIQNVENDITGMNYRCARDNCESDECECEDCDCGEYTQDECCDYFDSLDDIDDFCNCTGDYECESEDDFDESLKELDKELDEIFDNSAEIDDGFDDLFNEQEPTDESLEVQEAEIDDGFDLNEIEKSEDDILADIDDAELENFFTADENDDSAQDVHITKIINHIDSVLDKLSAAMKDRFQYKLVRVEPDGSIKDIFDR